jgi:hypothetical protein
MMRCWFSSIVAALACAMTSNDAGAQSETFSAAAVSEQGGRFTLVIYKTGNRLKFDLNAQSAQSSLSGLAVRLLHRRPHPQLKLELSFGFQRKV